MQVARRHCWAEEERPRPLMPCSDPLWLIEAPLALARLTGIDVSLIPEAEVSVFCVPLAEDDWPERGLRRWEGTRADALWHPLLWLPRRLAAPTVALTPDGVAVEEPLERWQARVAFEIIDSGLYTDDGWVDVYALLGLSLESRDDVDRVQAWLTGQPDPLLDGFSLEPFFADDQGTADSRAGRSGPAAELDGPVRDWSADLAAEVAPLLVSSSKALMADSLLCLAADLAGPELDLADEAFARGAWWLATLAVEAVADGGAGIGGVDAWPALLDEVQAAGADRAAVGSALDAAVPLLIAARDAHWPALAELQRFAADVGEQDEATAAAPADLAAERNLPVASLASARARAAPGESPPTHAGPVEVSPACLPASDPSSALGMDRLLTAPKGSRVRHSMIEIPAASAPRAGCANASRLSTSRHLSSSDDRRDLLPGSDSTDGRAPETRGR